MKKNFILPILKAAVALFEFFTIESLLDAANAWNKSDLVTINIDTNRTILKHKGNETKKHSNSWPSYLDSCYRLQKRNIETLAHPVLICFGIGLVQITAGRKINSPSVFQRSCHHIIKTLGTLW